jgi:hypothetical protein
MQDATKIAQFELLPEGILQVTFLKGEDVIDLEEAKRHVEIGNSLTKGTAVPVMVDATQLLHELSKEGRDYIAQYSLKKAEAILVKELHQRIIATFYLKLSGKINKHPVKVFNKREDAIAWLKTFI